VSGHWSEGELKNSSLDASFSVPLMLRAGVLDSILNGGSCRLVMPKSSSELMQEQRTKRTKPLVQVQFSSVHRYWAVGSVLGSMIFKNLRTGFKPVRTELSVHIFF